MINNKRYIDKNDLLRELISKQLKNVVPPSKKLQYSDLKRICKYIDRSIFLNKKSESVNCCIWTGYITNEKNSNKGTYINFFYKNKKMALHRLLYINYVGELLSNEYLKFTCENKGKCCNVNHLEKFKYHCNEQKDTENNIEKLGKKESKLDLFLEFD